MEDQIVQHDVRRCILLSQLTGGYLTCFFRAIKSLREWLPSAYNVTNAGYNKINLLPILIVMHADEKNLLNSIYFAGNVRSNFQPRIDQNIIFLFNFFPNQLTSQ